MPVHSLFIVSEKTSSLLFSRYFYTFPGPELNSSLLSPLQYIADTSKSNNLNEFLHLKGKKDKENAGKNSALYSIYLSIYPSVYLSFIYVHIFQRLGMSINICVHVYLSLPTLCYYILHNTITLYSGSSTSYSPTFPFYTKFYIERRSKEDF